MTVSVPMRLRPPPNALPELVTRSDDTDILDYFGTALRSERIKAGHEPIDLAHKTGQSRSTVVMWETGRGIPRFTNLVRLLALYPALVDVLRDLAEQLAEHADEVEPNGTAA